METTSKKSLLAIRFALGNVYIQTEASVLKSVRIARVKIFRKGGNEWGKEYLIDGAWVSPSDFMGIYRSEADFRINATAEIRSVDKLSLWAQGERILGSTSKSHLDFTADLDDNAVFLAVDERGDTISVYDFYLEVAIDSGCSIYFPSHHSPLYADRETWLRWHTYKVVCGEIEDEVVGPYQRIALTPEQKEKMDALHKALEECYEAGVGLSLDVETDTLFGFNSQNATINSDGCGWSPSPLVSRFGIKNVPVFIYSSVNDDVCIELTENGHR